MGHWLPISDTPKLMTRNKGNSKTPEKDDLKCVERNLIMSRSDVMRQKCNVFMTTAEQLEEIQLVVFSYPLMMVSKYLK